MICPAGEVTGKAATFVEYGLLVRSGIGSWCITVRVPWSLKKTSGNQNGYRKHKNFNFTVHLKGSHSEYRKGVFKVPNLYSNRQQSDVWEV